MPPPNLYIPIFDVECDRCCDSPVVGIRASPNTIRSSGLCGPHFFNDSLMFDWEEWNEPRESTE